MFFKSVVTGILILHRTADLPAERSRCSTEN
jgi:hypothetical protein